MFTIFRKPQPSDYDIKRYPTEWAIGMNGITKKLILVRQLSEKEFILYDSVGRFLSGRKMTKDETKAQRFTTLKGAVKSFKRKFM